MIAKRHINNSKTPTQKPNKQKLKRFLPTKPTLNFHVIHNSDYVTTIMPKLSSPSTASKAIATSSQKLAHLFSFKKKDWGDNHKAHIKKIKLGNSTKGVDMAYYFHKINGSEHPELFILWLLEYCRNVLKADTITLTGNVNCLLQLIRGEAKSKVQHPSIADGPRANTNLCW